MSKHEIINAILDPRRTSLGSVGVAMVVAAKAAS